MAARVGSTLEADIVRCRMIEMRDDSDAVRVVVWIDNDGSPAVKLTSAKSEASLVVGFNDQGGVELNHVAKNGRKKCVAKIAEDGSIPTLVPPAGVST